MIQCCIASEIIVLIFIVPAKDRQGEEAIFNIYDVIADTLIHLGVKERWIPDIAVYYILPKESLSYKKVKRILFNLSKKDKW